MSPSRLASIAAASLLMIGTGLGTADAMPVAPLGAQAPQVEQVADLHPRYPGSHSRSARMYRHMRRMTPNRHCQKMPSRCR